MPRLADTPLSIEPIGSADLGPCACCGSLTRRVWGYAYRGDFTEAAYFVEWTPGSVRKHGAMFDLIIGRWGDESIAADRFAVSLALRWTERGPEFMVVDALDRSVAKSALVGRALDRASALETTIAQHAFSLVDAVWVNDRRIEELVSDA
jgi:hypothetical protein